MNSTIQWAQVPTYRIPQKKTSYRPVEDGFVCSAGNKELAQKYGNGSWIPGVTTQDLLVASYTKR